MNRCNTSYPLLAALIIFAAYASLHTLPALAQTEEAKPNIRNFPKTAFRGQLQVTGTPDALMDGKVDRLSPGSTIRDINNLLVLPGAVTGTKLVVNYTRDNIGLVQQVWILNPEEAKQKLPSQLAAAANTNDNDSGILSNIRSLFEPAPAPQDDGKTPYNQLPKYSR